MRKGQLCHYVIFFGKPSSECYWEALTCTMAWCFSAITRRLPTPSGCRGGREDVGNHRFGATPGGFAVGQTLSRKYSKRVIACFLFLFLLPLLVGLLGLVVAFVKACCAPWLCLTEGAQVSQSREQFSLFQLELRITSSSSKGTLGGDMSKRSFALLPSN